MTGAHRRLSATVFLLLAFPSGARAQTNQKCLDYYAKIVPKLPPLVIPSKACETVAAYVASMSKPVVDAADLMLKPEPQRIGSVFSQRDLQSKKTQQPSTAGSPAQGTAIPGSQPTGVAAGTLAMVGTKKGDEAIAALGLNPAVLFLADAVTQQLAQYSRIADVTVFLPVSKLDTVGAKTESDTKLKYVGARVRINLLGKDAGDQVWKGADSLIKKWIKNEGTNEQRVEALLAKAPDFEVCANAIIADKSADITAACGTPFSLGVDQKGVEALKAELKKVRAAADAKYFGADLRADFGDPTLGVVPKSSGRFWFAGLAAGRRLTGTEQEGLTYGIRARAGMRYAKLDSISNAEYAGEGGLGLEMARSIDDQEINASAALEFRYGNAPANTTDKFQTNFVMVRGSLLLPIFGSNAVSLNVGVPITGNVSPIMSVNFNWGLLLPDNKPQ